MKYSKPEVNTLGEAKSVIELVDPAKPFTNTVDGIHLTQEDPAYDLDE